MSRKTIAVDVDDVLADHVEAFLEWSNQKYGTTFTIDQYTDHWSDLWAISKEETESRAQLFHDEHHHRTFANKPGAIDVLQGLKNDYDLVIVTARRKAVVEDTHEWLAEHYPNIFVDIRFVPIWDKDNTTTKAMICQELGVSYLIDDMLRHCIGAAECGVEALLFGDFSWNQTESMPAGITRVADWRAVKEFFTSASR